MATARGTSAHARRGRSRFQRRASQHPARRAVAHRKRRDARLARDGERARRLLVHVQRLAARPVRAPRVPGDPRQGVLRARQRQHGARPTASRSASRSSRASAGRSPAASRNVRPFARVAWELESEDDDRFVSASSVTLGGSYSVPVIKPDNNYASIPGRRERGFRQRHRLRHRLGDVGARATATATA